MLSKGEYEIYMGKHIPLCGIPIVILAYGGSEKNFFAEHYLFFNETNLPVPVTVPYPFRRRQVISYNVDRHSLVELALDAAHASLQNYLDKVYLLTRDPLYSQVVQLEKQAQANVARLYRGGMCDEAFKAIAETTRCETLSDYLSQLFKSPPPISEDI